MFSVTGYKPTIKVETTGSLNTVILLGLLQKMKMLLRCLFELLISSINTKNIEEFANEGGSLLYP
ncbi:hypothetical protein BCU86_19535 [Vibrio lentus]|nr:hypothetical protein A6E08_20235 [Vibrio lentus]PMG63852.1 hypothetical protein BCU86_19535 [Vibrio lentus]PMI56729.1 hypothetical protein BCU43_15030 [Vibrio lentus]PMI58647.1 hypothetical protein BCU41_03280 [Vibrio lentus]